MSFASSPITLPPDRPPTCERRSAFPELESLRSQNPMAVVPTSPDRWCSASMKLLQTAETRECSAVQAVVDGEIARDDAQRITQMQRDFSNSELGQKISATEELMQFLSDALALVETEERLLAAEIVELAKMERSHLACLTVLQNIKAIRQNRPKGELVRDSVEHEFRKQINNLNGSVCRPRIAKLEGVQKELRAIRDDLQNDITLKAKALAVDDQVLRTSKVRTTPLRNFSPPQSLTSPKTWLQGAVNKIKKCNKHCQFAQGLRNKSIEYRRVRCAEVDSWNKSVLVELLQQCVAELEAFQVTLIDRLYEVEQDMAADLQEAVDLQNSIIAHEEPLHLAEERLRQRYRRPKSERVRDSAEKALEQEVDRLGMALAKLAAKKKKILANREKLKGVKDDIEANVVLKQQAVDVNLTCLYVLQHTDWEQAKEMAQSLDLDHDGVTTHEEIMALVQECVPKRDANKDGVMTADETLDYVKQRVAAGRHESQPHAGHGL